MESKHSFKLYFGFVLLHMIIYWIIYNKMVGDCTNEVNRYVRRIDVLGRIVIPKELRTILDINIKDPVEIFVVDEKIIFRNYKPNRQCIMTGEVNDDNLVLNENIVLSPIL